MVSERYLIAAALAISLLIHLAAIPLYDKFVKKPKQKEAAPIEVSYIPPKPETPKPPPVAVEPAKPSPLPPVPDYTENSQRETTFDESLVGGAKGEENKRPSQTASLPKVKPAPFRPDIREKPKEEGRKKANELSLREAEPASEDMPVPNIAGLMDTKDVVERIANKKKEQPKGQDTASYNKFEGKYASYFAKFKNSVYQIWDYPAQSVMKGETGTVRVSFSILKDGSIVNIKLLRSSGYPALDREVMRVLKNMRPTPLPSSYELEQLNVDDANFIYTIGRGWDIF